MAIDTVIELEQTMSRFSTLLIAAVFAATTALTIGLAHPTPALAANTCHPHALQPTRLNRTGEINGYGYVNCRSKTPYIKLWVMLQKYNYKYDQWETKAYRYGYNQNQDYLGFNKSTECRRGLWRTRATMEVIGSATPGSVYRPSDNSPTKWFGC